MTEGQDAIVIGGGVVGTTIAYALCRQGMKVTVLDGDGVGSGATGHGHGSLTLGPGSYEPGPHYEIGLAATRIFPSFIDELIDDGGVDPLFQQRPDLWVAFDETQEQTYREQIAKNPAHGDLEWLTGDECRAIEPRLTTEVCSGIRIPAGQVDGYLMALGAMAALERLGGQIVNRRATGLVFEGSRITGVRHTDGTLGADVVIVATGASAYEASAWIGCPVPVKPLHGELLHVRMPGEPIPVFIRTLRNGPLVQRRDGIILVGSIYGSLRRPDGTVELGKVQQPIGPANAKPIQTDDDIILDEPASADDPVYFDLDPTPEARDLMIESALSIMPALEDAEIVGHLAGVRPVSGDLLPIVGPVPGADGVFLAVGHGTKGIHLAPPTAALIADYVVRGVSTQAFPAEPFLPSRFLG